MTINTTQDVPAPKTEEELSRVVEEIYAAKPWDGLFYRFAYFIVRWPLTVFTALYCLASFILPWWIEVVLCLISITLDHFIVRKRVATGNDIKTMIRHLVQSKPVPQILVKTNPRVWITALLTMVFMAISLQILPYAVLFLHKFISYITPKLLLGYATALLIHFSLLYIFLKLLLASSEAAGWSLIFPKTSKVTGSFEAGTSSIVRTAKGHFQHLTARGFNCIFGVLFSLSMGSGLTVLGSLEFYNPTALGPSSSIFFMGETFLLFTVLTLLFWRSFDVAKYAAQSYIQKIQINKDTNK